ncbi:hypothetical protein ACFYKX_02295 [Cytobacillus sp. FJAT-54145]|uniref:Uncharacterized protein n=1 Tax=Cytobacillus spartinae TaxID=3299023 RepID=A0ABW6K5I5_9BACI
MKKMFLSTLLVLTLFTFTYNYSFAKKPELTEECKQNIEETRKEYSRIVMQDLLHSFDPFKEKNEDEYLYFTARELWKSQLLVGNNEAFDSLKKLMSGSFRGEKRLYFVTNEPNTGYILYKNIDSQNVMETINRKNSGWVLSKKEIKQGRDISMEPVKCTDEHFMQKMFDNLYP